MISAAHSAFPKEACGILFGEEALIDTVLESRNVHPDPLRHFEIEPQALIDALRAERAGGAKVAGYFHSHPSGLAAPSKTDRAQSARDGKVWAIVAGEVLELWRDDPEGFQKLTYSIVEG